MTQTRVPPPGPAQLGRVLVHPSIDRTSAAGLFCRLLLAHDPVPDGAGLRETGMVMAGIANGLGLGLPHEEPRFIGSVLRMHTGATTVGPLHQERLVFVSGRTILALEYGHESCVLRVPDPPGEWVRLASMQLRVHISVGLDPASEMQEPVEAYARRLDALGRLRTGIAAIRSSST